MEAFGLIFELKKQKKDGLDVKSAKYFENTTVAHVTISNSSDAPFTLRNQSKYHFYNLTDLVIVQAHGEVNIDVRTIKKTRKFELEFEVLSALPVPQTHPFTNIIIRVNQEFLFNFNMRL